MKTIIENISNEYIEKKSKFIANIFYVSTEEEAENKIKQIKKKYYDAKHNCYAYSITNKKGQINKMSDDGEPSGTAGAPILNIINKNELTNILIIVTRYFGGILLGTGGLVRAYSEAVLGAINKSNIQIEQEGYDIEVSIEYKDLEKLKYYCNQNNINIKNTEYNEIIKCILEMTDGEKNKILDTKEELNFKIQEIKVLKQIKIRKNIEI